MINSLGPLPWCHFFRLFSMVEWGSEYFNCLVYIWKVLVPSFLGRGCCFSQSHPFVLYIKIYHILMACLCRFLTVADSCRVSKQIRQQDAASKQVSAKHLTEDQAQGFPRQVWIPMAIAIFAFVPVRHQAGLFCHKEVWLVKVHCFFAKLDFQTCNWMNAQALMLEATF